MTAAPPGTRKRRTPKDPALTTRPSDDTDTTKVETEFDFDERVVDQVNWSIWRAIHQGELRIATPCDVCGRWLTDSRSKRAHRGPRCAAKAVG